MYRQLSDLSIYINNTLCNTSKSQNQFEKPMVGVPVMAQWLTNPTSNHKVMSLILGLTQWVKDLALL